MNRISEEKYKKDIGVYKNSLEAGKIVELLVF